MRFFVRKAFHHVARNHCLKACATAIILASRFSDLISCRTFLNFQSWLFREANDSADTILFRHDQHVRLVFSTSADFDIILFFFDWSILLWCRVQLWSWDQRGLPLALNLSNTWTSILKNHTNLWFACIYRILVQDVFIWLRSQLWPWLWISIVSADLLFKVNRRVRVNIFHDLHPGFSILCL